MIASNRRYMRGAGTADHTGDGSRTSSVDPALVEEETRRMMLECAVEGVPLQFGKQPIVACDYGRLYHKEAAVAALLRSKTSGTKELGEHIRGLKDLHEVRFHTIESKGRLVPACPITGKELNGKIVAIALIPGNLEQPNVVSERATKEMGDLLFDYGPIEQKIHLAPTPSTLEEIKKDVAQKRKDKKAAKKDKKRKKHSNDDAKDAKPKKSKAAA